MFKLQSDFAVKIFFRKLLNARNGKNSAQRATYEEVKFPTFHDPRAVLKIQAFYFDKPFVITRPTQDDYVEDGP
jgi:hypothetical protein